MAAQHYSIPLPCHGKPCQISEILSFPKQPDVVWNGNTVRVVGRVKEYNPDSRVLLLEELPFVGPSPSIPSSTSARPKPSSNHSSTSTSSLPAGSSTRRPVSTLVVDAQLTDDLDCCRRGSLVMFIGELETWPSSRLADIPVVMDSGSPLAVNRRRGNVDHWKSDIVLKAVISKCVDLLDHEMYLRCMTVWRRDLK